MEPTRLPASYWSYARRSSIFVRPFTGRLTLVLFLALFGAGLGAIDPLLTKFLFDGLTEGASLRHLALGVGAMLGLALLREAVSAVQNIITWKVRIQLDTRMRDIMTEHLYSLPLAYHQDKGVGYMMTRLERGIAGYINAFSEIALGTLPTLVFLGGSLWAMFNLHAGLGLVLVIFTPLPALIGMWAAREQTSRERDLSDRWSRIFGRLNEALTGIWTVKSFAREREEKDRFMRDMLQALGIVSKGINTDTAVGSAKNFTVTLARLVALAYGGFLVLRGEITVGTLLAFLSYIGGIFGPVQGLTNIYQTLRKASVALEMIYEILDADNPIADRPNAKDAGTLRGAVEFRNLSFSYAPEKPVFQNLNLNVEEGERVALVGPSGVGKTTLMSLLQRLRDPTDGAILIDGIDIRTVTQRSLRSQMAMVLQDALLFNDTIADNIAYGRPDASKEEIVAAAKAANAHDFIVQLPEGYETMAGERGNLLSAGQKQRIAIARALLVNPPILILDEATSALDAESEALVQEALETLMKGRTTFVIAHRLATVVHADRIVVLRNGEIAEMGNHQDLLQAGGYYAQLVQKQTEGLLAIAA